MKHLFENWRRFLQETSSNPVKSKKRKKSKKQSNEEVQGLDPLAPTPEEEEELSSLPDRGRNNAELQPPPPDPNEPLPGSQDFMGPVAATPAKSPPLAATPKSAVTVKAKKTPRVTFSRPMRSPVSRRKKTNLKSFLPGEKTPSTQGSAVPAVSGISSAASSLKTDKQQKGMEKSNFAASDKIKGIKIAAVGDSLTVGVGNNNKSYIDYLGGQKFAIGGKATYQLLGKADQAIQASPEFLIIWMGTNNPFLGNRHGSCGKADAVYNKIVQDLSSVYTKAKNAGIKVIGISLPNPSERWTIKYNRTLNCPPDMHGSSALCKQRAKELRAIRKSDPNREQLTRQINRRYPGGAACCTRCPDNEMRNPKKMWAEFKRVNQWIKSNADIFIQLPGAPGSDAGYGRSNDAVYDRIHLNDNYQRQLAALIQSKIEE